jgi:hypothetical protein
MNLPDMLPRVIPSRKTILTRSVAARNTASMGLGAGMIFLMTL